MSASVLHTSLDNERSACLCLNRCFFSQNLIKRQEKIILKNLFVGEEVMKNKQGRLKISTFTLCLLILSVSTGMLSRAEQESKQSLQALLPSLEGMVSVESPQTYYPETLFEYINGAAEIYLSYGFIELIVVQYKRSDAAGTVTVEVYDMGDHRNSFGIYSAERYPDNEVISLGTQGYVEEGALNFLVGCYYVKLLCFDCEDRADEMLQTFAIEIVKRVEERGGFPVLLKAFPSEGRLPNTEKFILKNFMGYRFLHDGYLVNYEVEGLPFDCFLIEGENPDEAREMLNQYLEAKGASNVEEISSGYRVKDKYYHNIYLAPVNKYICGVMKIKDGNEGIAERYLAHLVKSLEKLDF